ncbi:VOC family protein [Phycicoccus endophyticus]|uniref:VOC family protein n=1 Tax=Phycicoccus endophyticus TaxID=1690220 RepID=A0A7G9R466_9MICO|nr:VOC family protein [Phycicoccus endophyticus]NHI18239.1 VOC family protein [Phycicoccus endophyticus]QNN50391.1 VOC family protein [Phycicoccus endophyticus]GGL25272.1 hypothetical protein GCM10012283_04360 [Phycicoccus endophyticus]
MYLENLCLDAGEPLELAAFWEGMLGGGRLAHGPDLVELRLDVEGGASLDLCLPRVPGGRTGPGRLLLRLAAGCEQAQERARALGARRLGPGGGRPAATLADPEGQPFELAPAGTGHGGVDLAAIVLESADPGRDLAFWQWATGWEQVDGAAATLQRRDGEGPRLTLRAEQAPKGGREKNPAHLDIRLEGEDELEAALDHARHLGARELDHGWGPLPWRVLLDPSGNEVCLLPARS